MAKVIWENDTHQSEEEEEDISIRSYKKTFKCVCVCVCNKMHSMTTLRSNRHVIAQF